MSARNGHERSYFDSRNLTGCVGFNSLPISGSSSLGLTRCLRLLDGGGACSSFSNYQTSQVTEVIQFDSLAKGGALGYAPNLGQISFRPNVRSVQLRDSFVSDLLCRFLVNLWGSQVTLCFFSNLQRFLSLQECVFISLQQHSVFSLAPAPCYTPNQRERYPWSNGFLAVYLSVNHRDPVLLINWLQDSLKVMSMFAHLRFFSVLGLVLRFTVSSFFGDFKLRGFNFYLVGNISVAGNAMSRAYGAFAGKRGNSSLALKLASNFALIRTPTGCLGFTLSYFF